MNQSLFTNTIRPFGAGLALWLLGALLISAQAATNRLESIQTTALGSGEAEIVLTLSGPAPKPSVFTVTQPAQMSIDLANTTLDIEQRYRQVEAGPVTGLTLAADGGRTRVVVQLTQPVSYSVERNNNEIRIVVHASAGAAAGNAPAVANRVTDIDFRRGSKGSGRVEITLSGSGGPIDIDDQDGRIIATLPNTYLPDNLEKRLDVMDFATPVQFVDIFGRGDNTRVVVTPARNAQYKRMAYQSGNQFVIELEPITPAEVQQERKQKQDNKPQFSGEKISLSFQKVDIRAVLQIIADVADVNLVVSDNVSGQITLRLESVPWDQALNIVLQAQGLGMRRIGNVISIAPLAQIAQRERAELEAYEATRNLSPLQSEIIQVNYAKASDIATLIQSGAGETAMLSKRGRVTVDQRTNSLLVTDTASKLQNIRRVIDRLDIPVRQVLIEARIVVANRDFSRQLGVTQSVNDSAAFESPTDGNYLADTGYTVNLPVAGPAGVLTTSIIGDTFSLDLALSALETENRGEIISSPRVITTDGQEAVIEQGQEVPYTTQQGADDPATTEFKEVVLNLTVTPHITPNEHVLLEMDLTQDNVSGFSQDGEPIIDTRSVQTQVLVDDGNTVVLGGIYQQKHSNAESQVPILGDLPLIGALFSGTSRQHEKLELLIFITPKILQETLTAN